MTVNVTENFCKILSENYPKSLNWLKRQNLLSEVSEKFFIEYGHESEEEMVFLVPLFVRLEIENNELRSILLIEHALKAAKTEGLGFQVIEIKEPIADFSVEAGKILVSPHLVCNLKVAEAMILEALEEGISLPWKELRKILQEAAGEIQEMEFDQAYFGLRQKGIKV